LLGRSHRLEALTVFNRELYWHTLLRTRLSLGSPTPEVSSYDDFDVRSEELIPSGHDFHDDAHCDDLEEDSDPSSLLAAAPS